MELPCLFDAVKISPNGRYAALLAWRRDILQFVDIKCNPHCTVMELNLSEYYTKLCGFWWFEGEYGFCLFTVYVVPLCAKDGKKEEKEESPEFSNACAPYALRFHSFAGGPRGFLTFPFSPKNIEIW